MTHPRNQLRNKEPNKVDNKLTFLNNKLRNRYDYEQGKGTNPLSHD